MLLLAALLIAIGLAGILLRKWLIDVTLNSEFYRISRWRPSGRFYELLALVLGVICVSAGLAIIGTEATR